MFKREELIPSAEEILDQLPLPAELKKIKAERDGLRPPSSAAKRTSCS